MQMGFDEIFNTNHYVFVNYLDKTQPRYTGLTVFMQIMQNNQFYWFMNQLGISVCYDEIVSTNIDINSIIIQ